MNLVFGLLILVSSACSTTSIEHSFEDFKEFVSYKDFNYWLDYGQETLELSSKESKLRRQRLSKASASGSWVKEFKLALHLGLQAQSLGDYKRSLRLLKGLSKADVLDSDGRRSLEWFQLHIRSQYTLAEKLEEYRNKSEEMKKKLRALSKIEQKIQKRSQRIVH